MTCEECLHYEVCSLFSKADGANHEYYTYANLSEKCECFKDKSERVHLPCKASDVIFLPWRWNGASGIACLTVLRIVLTEDESYVETDFDSDDYDYFMNYNCGRFWFEDFGIMVFSTKEKAEKALAKMKAEEQNNKCCISQHGDVQYCEYYGAWRCLNPDCKIPVLTSTLVGAHPNGCPYCDKWNSKKAEGEKDNAEIH